MGVYIKGMELPNEGVEWICFVRLTNRTAEFFDPTGEYESVLYKALEIPEHGRLVDADKLCKVLEALAADDWNQGAAPFSWSYAYDCMADTVDTMPTVIPKEDDRA